MKVLWQFVAPTVRAVVAVSSVLVGIGWSAFLSIQMIVKAEGNAIRTEFESKRSVDIQNIHDRFDDTHAMLREIKHDIRELRKSK